MVQELDRPKELEHVHMMERCFFLVNLVTKPNAQFGGYWYLGFNHIGAVPSALFATPC
jgi:hypothetical protein